MSLEKIKITYDRDGVYDKDSVHEVMDVIESYCSCATDKSLVDYIERIPIPSAIAFIADAWGLNYEFV
jgi:hypothetical protein